PNTALWLDGCGLRDNAPFGQFDIKFKFAFVSSDFGNKVRAPLASLRMTSTVDRYVSEARQPLTVLLVDVDGYSTCKDIEFIARISFIQGFLKAVNGPLRA
ncbi:hypothetical protein BGZ98_006090, partial [Dissophora globulifera]